MEVNTIIDYFPVGCLTELNGTVVPFVPQIQLALLNKLHKISIPLI